MKTSQFPNVSLFCVNQVECFNTLLNKNEQIDLQTFAYKPSQFHEKHQRMEPEFEYRKYQELFYNLGLYGLVFALCWATIPFYKLFCAHFGLEGDLIQKDYSAMSRNKLAIHRKFKLIFKAEMDPAAKWDFEPVQSELIVHAGETALVFYRAFNKEEVPIVGFSTYQIFPEDAALYFAKIQCFCFNQQLLNPKEEVMLPIYFYLETEINDDPLLKKTEEIYIQYRFFKSMKQDLARMAEDELKKVKRNKMVLMMMRAKNVGKTLDDKEFSDIRDVKISDEELEEFSEYDFEQTLSKQQ